ncbi:Coatomer subunit beta-1 [Morella rubra]|uniref:Coatomer subunit beta-1 n=1 Tax=Morella rubra TaxID=262757 RepID=A0A6A1W567_9ROSI|nr:Coatomer subunit beta-1 [Morella rubra]
MSPPTFIQGSLSSVGNLRSLILSGDFFLGAVVACTLTKLVLRLEEVQPLQVEVNRISTEALLIMVSMLQLGESSALPHPIDNDSRDRIVICMRLLCNTGDEKRKIWLQSCRQSFVKMLADKQLRETEEIKAKAQISNAQPDDLIDFYHLKSRKGMSQLELEDEVQDDLKRATGEFTKDGDDANKLNRILQLTGFSDPVYAEAYVTVHHYDIVLDVTVINRTKETLQNLCLELATMGDLKLVERPQNYTLAPESSKQIKANIKVSSTETGVIFGNIVYETSSNVLERNVIVLNDIHIDIMDYISPASCAEVAFRTMWAEFEWENKVAVNTVIQDEKEFLDHVIKSTNMKCLTPQLANPQMKWVFHSLALSLTPTLSPEQSMAGGALFPTSLLYIPLDPLCSEEQNHRSSFIEGVSTGTRPGSRVYVFYASIPMVTSLEFSGLWGPCFFTWVSHAASPLADPAISYKMTLINHGERCEAVLVGTPPTVQSQSWVRPLFLTASFPSAGKLSQ